MLGMDKHKEAGRNVFMGSVMGLANVLALAVAFLTTPKIYSFTIVWVARFVVESYGEAWVSIACLGWWIITAATVFYTARASIGTLLIMGGLAIAIRMI